MLTYEEVYEIIRTDAPILREAVENRFRCFPVRENAAVIARELRENARSYYPDTAIAQRLETAAQAILAQARDKYLPQDEWPRRLAEIRRADRKALRKAMRTPRRYRRRSKK